MSDVAAQTKISRWSFWREVLWRWPLALIALPWALWGVAAFVRDEIIEPTNPERYHLGAMLRRLGWPWWIWALASLAILVILTLEGAYRAVRKREDAIGELRSDLERRLRLVPQHAASYQLFVSADQNETPLHEYHRVVALNAGIESVDDAHAYLHKMNGQTLSMAPVELHPMHENDPRQQRRPIRMLHETPVAWDLLRYRHADDTFTVEGRDYSPTLKLFTPIEFEISIVGERIGALWLIATLTGELHKPLAMVVRSREPQVK